MVREELGAELERAAWRAAPVPPATRAARPGRMKQEKLPCRLMGPAKQFLQLNQPFLAILLFGKLLHLAAQVLSNLVNIYFGVLLRVPSPDRRPKPRTHAQLIVNIDQSGRSSPPR